MAVAAMPLWRKNKAAIGQSFEFHVFDSDAEFMATETHFLKDASLARSKAGRIAKKNGGPVDLAYAGGAEWSDRYITTALPSTHHKTGYQFGRI